MRAFFFDAYLFIALSFILTKQKPMVRCYLQVPGQSIKRKSHVLIVPYLKRAVIASQEAQNPTHIKELVTRGPTETWRATPSYCGHMMYSP